MREPPSPISHSMSGQVTKSWEAYGNKDVIFYQHLEPFDKAQEKLSELIALNTIGATQNFKVETTKDFLTFFLKSLLKVRIKMEKYQTEKADIAFTKRVDETIKTIINGEWIKTSLLDYTEILFYIGRIYERLGYSSPERERTRTNMQSDMELPGTSTPEYMENPPSETKYNYPEEEEI